MHELVCYLLKVRSKFIRKDLEPSSIARNPIFTKNVMGRILKDPAVTVRFITKDEKQNNIWLIMSIGIMLVGFFLFYFIKNGFNFSQAAEDFQTPAYLKAFADFFANFWNELSLSPYVLIALLGVVFLVVIDRTIVKYLYSI